MIFPAIRAAAAVGFVSLALLGICNASAETDPATKAIELANHQFDKALSARDVAEMENVWVRDAHVAAIHPSSKAPIVGWEAVRKSWETTFDRFSEIAVSMKDPQIRISQNVAWVVGVEAVQGKLKNGDAAAFAAVTTNIFEKHGERWLMVFHSSSRVPQ